MKDVNWEDVQQTARNAINKRGKYQTFEAQYSIEEGRLGQVTVRHCGQSSYELIFRDLDRVTSVIEGFETINDCTALFEILDYFTEEGVLLGDTRLFEKKAREIAEAAVCDVSMGPDEKHLVYPGTTLERLERNYWKKVVDASEETLATHIIPTALWHYHLKTHLKQVEREHPG